MRQCPFCNQDVRVDALKCHHCDELLRCKFCGTPAFYSQRPPRDLAGFGKHLLDRGFVTIEQLMAALDRQLALREPIGLVARRLGKLTAEQVYQVLNTQRQVAKPFGQVAIELGFANAPEVDEMRAAQQRSAPRLGELLVELGYLEAGVLAREIQAYHDSILIEPAAQRAPFVRELRTRR